MPWVFPLAGPTPKHTARRVLEEVVEEPYLKYRIRSTAYLADKLTTAGVPIIQPAGGHAIYLDGYYPGNAKRGIPEAYYVIDPLGRPSAGSKGEWWPASARERPR